MAYSGEGNLIEGQVEGDPNKTVVPVAVDSQGHLIIDLEASSITIGKVQIEDTAGNPLNSVAGSLDVNVTNLPGTQPVSGTVTANQGTPNLAINAWPVTVENFPGTQPISGTVAVSNFPATQPISGSVSVSNFPSSQAVTGTFFQSTQPVSEINLDKNFGTWAYYSGTSGTVTVTAGQRVLGIGAHATSAGSFTINGGSSIPVPATVSVNINPLANLTAPTIVFTGTDSYFVEVVS